MRTLILAIIAWATMSAAYSASAQCGAYTELESTHACGSPGGADWCSSPREVVTQPNVGIGFTGLCATEYNVPDPHLAAGPMELVAVVNGGIGFFNKSGALTFATVFFSDSPDTPGFWDGLGVQGGGANVADPRVVYDPTAGRFVAISAEGNALPGKFILIAVSDDSDPCGLWHKYRIDIEPLIGNFFLDQPHLGVDATAIHVSGFRTPSTNPNYGILSFAKAPLLAGLAPTVCKGRLVATSSNTAGLVPVAHGAPHTYFISDGGLLGTDAIQFLALSDALGTGSISVSYVAADQSPILCSLNPLVVPQKLPPPSTGLVAAIGAIFVDMYFMSVSYADGKLWATQQQLVGSGSAQRVLAKWYEFDLHGWPGGPTTPSIVQKGFMDPTPLSGTVHTSYPAICANPFGDAAMVANSSSLNQYVSITTSYRLASQAVDTMSVPARRKVSNGSWVPFSQFCARLGDYSAVSDDPDGQRFWAHQAYVVDTDGNPDNGAEEWRTWIVEIPLVSAENGLSPALGPVDVTGDGMIDSADFALALQAWSEVGGVDLDGDGALSGADLDLVISPWVAAIASESAGGE